MINLYDFVTALNEASLPTDIINPSASGMAANIILQTWKVKSGQRFITNFVLGEMGAGLPYSIGAALASGHRIIQIEGDGGLQINIQELETIGRLNLPIIIFVINNNGYASIRNSQLAAFGRVTGADDTSGVTLPHLLRIADAYRIDYYYNGVHDFAIRKYYIRETNEVSLCGDTTIGRILSNNNKPVIVDVQVDPNQKYRNRVPSKLVNGAMTTAPMDEVE